MLNCLLSVRDSSGNPPDFSLGDCSGEPALKGNAFLFILSCKTINMFNSE